MVILYPGVITGTFFIRIKYIIFSKFGFDLAKIFIGNLIFKPY
jgi:hypothetical protein